MFDKPIIGILLGDACGIGPEIVAKLCDMDRLYSHCNPVIIGDKRILDMAKEQVNARFTTQIIDDISEANWDAGFYPIIDQKDVNPEEIKIGEVSEIAGKASGDMLIKAMDLCLAGKLDGFTFAPLNMVAMRKGGYNFESENKLFAHYLNVKEPTSEVNMLDGLWNSRVTSHIPIKDISKFITVDNILGAIRLVNKTVSLAEADTPLIGVAALNPHAGEKGTCGKEEIDIILPAIEKAREEGINISGPYPADILFLKAFNGEFNAVVTMYHDQGQIALKLKGFQYGVTFHANLPIAIATPAHGTAFDIVGKGIAMTDAMENAVKMTARIASRYKLKNSQI